MVPPPPAPAPSPLILRWQGLLAGLPTGSIGRNLPLLAGWVLCALMAGLPLVTRSGLSLLIAACSLLWVVWALRTPPGRIGTINGWLLLVLGITVMATGFSPAPLAALPPLSGERQYESLDVEHPRVGDARRRPLPRYRLAVQSVIPPRRRRRRRGGDDGRDAVAVILPDIAAAAAPVVSTTGRNANVQTRRDVG